MVSVSKSFISPNPAGSKIIVVFGNIHPIQLVHSTHFINLTFDIVCIGIGLSLCEIRVLYATMRYILQ